MFANKNLGTTLLSFCVLCTLAVSLWIGNAGVRGSDQYWYLDDTKTLMHGSEPTTNTVLPGYLLRNPENKTPTLFIHNGPVLYINAFLGKTIGAFEAWKLANIIYYLLSAIITGLIVRFFVQDFHYSLAVILYAVAPVAVWQAGNLLQETFLTFLSASIFLFMLSATRTNSHAWTLPPLLFIGTLSHPFFLAIGAVYCLWSLLQKRILISIVILISVALAAALKNNWFPSSFQPNLEILITSTIPDMTNMLWQLSDNTVELNAELLVQKTLAALKTQFLVPTLAPFYITTNIGGLALLYLLFSHRKKFSTYLLFAFLYYGLYVGMAILMQNQPRYQLLITPVAISAIILAVSSIGWRKFGVSLVAVCCFGFLAIDGLLLKRLHASAVSEKTTIESVTKSIDFIREDQRVVVIGSEVASRISLVSLLKPRPTLLIQRNLLNQAKTISVLATFKADFIISDMAISENLFNAESIQSTMNNGHLGNLFIYQLR